MYQLPTLQAEGFKNVKLWFQMLVIDFTSLAHIVMQQTYILHIVSAYFKIVIYIVVLEGMIS